MKKFAVIGNPILHSLSPAMHNWIFEKLKINAEYIKINIEPNQIPVVLNKIRTKELNGINVTLPYKQNIIEYLDDINIRASKMGTVNCIFELDSKLIGFNTDWYGFSKAIENNSIHFKNEKIILIGAGGTTKSIIFALKQLGVKKIFLFNRTLKNAKLLEDDIVMSYQIDCLNKFIDKYTIIINTTPLGMNEKDQLFDLNLLTKNHIIMDVIYTPLETSFLRQGNKIGATTINGLDMFMYQGLASLDLWFGEAISKSVNFEQLKTYLKTKLC